jgi:pimeloyl-ACP methyl ester carboxylesterase
MQGSRRHRATSNVRDLLRVAAAVSGCAIALAAVPTAAAASPPGVQTVRVRGIRLAYRVSGTGPPLLLINGSGATLDTWDPLLLGGLSVGRRVIVFDPRGMGASTTTTTTTDRLTVQEMADDAAALLSALRIKRADVLGWSLGGFVAQALAIRHPLAVRRLVLASTSAGGRTATTATRKVQAIDDKTTLGLATPNEFLPILFPPAALSAGKAWIARLLAQPGGCCEHFSRQAGQRQIQAEHAWYQPNGGSDKQLGQIKAKTLIAAGALDVDIPVANARLLHRKIPGSKLLVYKDAGHAFLIQHATQFAAAVLHFLRQP